MSLPLALLQTISISTSLLSAGGIAALTLFSNPSLQSLPASRSLPQIRWLFSRGSHIFPTAAFLSSTGFACLAFLSLPLPAGQRSLVQFLRASMSRGSVGGNVAAALLCLSIGPMTSLMLPTNLELIRMGEERGAKRSEKSAEMGTASREGEEVGVGKKDTALDALGGKGQAAEFKDVSGPQGKAGRDTTKDEDGEVRRLLGEFGRWNILRAILLGGGGVLGLVTALA